MREMDESERSVDAIHAENRLLLREFESWLQAKGLGDKTVAMHRDNIAFYVDDFLLYDDATRAADGMGSVGRFLGYWFIRKALWASPSSIRSFATSLKKFYDFMAERGEVEIEAVNDMKQEIKYRLPEWIDTVRRYDDPNTNLENFWL